MARICYNVDIQSGLAILDHFLTPNHHAEILRLYVLACIVWLSESEGSLMFLKPHKERKSVQLWQFAQQHCADEVGSSLLLFLMVFPVADGDGEWRLAGRR